MGRDLGSCRWQLGLNKHEAGLDRRLGVEEAEGRVVVWLLVVE